MSFGNQKKSSPKNESTQATGSGAMAQTGDNGSQIGTQNNFYGNEGAPVGIDGPIVSSGQNENHKAICEDIVGLIPMGDASEIRTLFERAVSFEYTTSPIIASNIFCTVYRKIIEKLKLASVGEESYFLQIEKMIEELQDKEDTEAVSSYRKKIDQKIHTMITDLKK